MKYGESTFDILYLAFANDPDMLGALAEILVFGKKWYWPRLKRLKKTDGSL